MGIFDSWNKTDITEEALPEQSTGEYNNLPDYIIAADVHDVFASEGKFTITDPTTWLNPVENATMFSVAAVTSGVASIYNSGVALGNVFGLDAEEAQTDAILADVDSRLSDYYLANKQGADVVGFIAGSFVPGSLAIKATRAAKAGTMGSNMARATNLLVPETDNLIVKAGKELANRQAAFTMFDRTVVQAFAKGVQGAVAESIIAEAAVTATMFKSPVLEGMDFGDITSNIFWGGVVGGTIGGALSAAKIYGGVKRVVTKADAGATGIKAITLETAMPKTASEADRIIMRTKDAERFAIAEVSDDVLTPVNIERTRKQSIENLMLTNRLGFQTLSGSDTTLANTIADGMYGLTSQQHFENLLGLQQIGRVGTALKGEKSLEELTKQIELADVADLVHPTLPTQRVGYLRLHGDNAGNLSWDKPVVTRLADTVANNKELDRAVSKHGFTPTSALDAKHATKADAHYIWAEQSLRYRKDMVVDKSSIPAMMALERKLATTNEPISIVLRDAKGHKETITSIKQLAEVRMQVQEEIAHKMLGKGVSIEETSTVTNLKESYLLGVKGKTADLDHDARLAANKAYTEMLLRKGLHHNPNEIVDISTRPQFAKVLYDTAERNLPNGFELDAMTHYAAKWKLYESGVRRAIARVAGDFNLDRFVKATDEELLSSTRYDASAGYLSATNAGYSTLGSKMQMAGRTTQDFTTHLQKITDDTLAPATQRLLADPEAAIEFSTVNKIVSQSPERYVFSEDTNSLIPARLKNWLDAGQEGDMPTFTAGVVEEIPLNRPATIEAVRAHIMANRSRGEKMQTLRNAQGLEDVKNLDAFYPIRKDYRDFKHYAFVIDDTITGTGHVSMIHAPDEQTLAAMISKVPTGLRAITDRGSKLYHKALGDYDYERTLHDTQIDSALKRAGIDSDYAIDTDPQVIVNKLLAQHYRADSTLARETVRASNEKIFTALEQLGEQYTNIASSKKGGFSKASEQLIDNPYENYIKTALNISTVNEHSLITGFNTAMDSAFSGVVSTLRNAFGNIKKPQDLEQIHDILESHGIRGAYQDAAMTAYANITPNRGELSRFVRGANSIISTLALGTDPFHAVANAVGNNVLLGFEVNHLVKAIKAGNPEIAGKLSKLAEITVPGSKGVPIISGKKLYANALKDWLGADKEGLLKAYTDLGFNPSFRRQVHQLHQDLIITGTENAGQLQSKLSKGFDKFSDLGLTLSGNKLSEEFNRFITVNVAKQITDLAEQAGIYSRAESLATINTFLNRVQGNITASQRPLVFQGPVGMAMGLFQTYQFNLLQQMFRAVAEGTPKDALMLLGLQGSIFGMNGLPAFNFLNTHIVGTASGNQSHKDLYDATYGIVGKEAGDWLMYGAASNFPKLLGGEGTNLYTRGDINPRYVTILPNEVSEIPLVRAGTAVWNTLAGTVQQLGVGAPAGETLLQAMEHNSLSRPLAGLAQVLQAAGNGGNVYATDKNSVLRGSNDLLSVTSLMRMAGGRPMDESLSVDYYYRLKAYDAKDRTLMEKLRSAVRKSVIQGNTLDSGEYGKFAEEYLKAGGKHKNFNKFIMQQYTEANTTAAQKLSAQLANPHAQRMQEFLRGRTVTAEELAPPLQEPTNESSPEDTQSILQQ